MSAFLTEIAATIYAIAKREDLLEAPPSLPNFESHPRSADPISVVAADYSAGHLKEDVTTAVRGCIHDGVLNVMADTVALKTKDPKYGYKKTLRIHCHLYGKDRIFFVPEGERLILP